MPGAKWGGWYQGWGVDFANSMCWLMVTVGIAGRQGVIPGDNTANLEEFTADDTVVPGAEQSAAVKASSLLSILSSSRAWSNTERQSRVWLGEGLGTISRRTYEAMMKWQYVDLAEFRPRGALEKVQVEEDTEKLVVLPGFEVSQARKKPITSIAVWSQCFARYTAAMAAKFPDCAPGFMSHLVTVVKAYLEVEEPVWRLYDEVYREKMAATGVKQWKGMDIGLYQEICGGRRRKWSSGTKKTERASSARPGTRRVTKRSRVCWDFNERGSCGYGRNCKFAHECSACGGNHPKFRCTEDGRIGKQARPA